MKSIRKKLAVITACLFMIMASVGVASASVKRTKSYRYDDNIYIGATNFHNYTYIDVPNDAKENGRDSTRVGGGWNYDRYEVVIYYKSSSGNF